MEKRHRSVLCLCLIAVWGVCAATDKDPGDPEATVRSLLSSVKVLSETKDAKVEAQTVQQISGTFDVVGLSQACLRKTWDTLSAAEQKNFVNLF